MQCEVPLFPKLSLFVVSRKGRPRGSMDSQVVTLSFWKLEKLEWNKSCGSSKYTFHLFKWLLYSVKDAPFPLRMILITKSMEKYIAYTAEILFFYWSDLEEVLTVYVRSTFRFCKWLTNFRTYYTTFLDSKILGIIMFTMFWERIV